MIPQANQSGPTLTLDDLYGKSKDEPKEPAKIEGEISINSRNEPLVYEETPILEPVGDTNDINPEPDKLVSTQTMPSMPSGSYPKPKNSTVKSILVNSILLLIIFFLGIGITLLWRYIKGSNFKTQTSSAIVKTPTTIPTETPESTISAEITPQMTPILKITPTGKITTVTPIIIKPGSVAGWQKIAVGTKAGYSVPEITLEIPSDINLLVCDPPGCSSEGTELTGKTRLTVAVRKLSKPIDNFEKSKITDAGEKVFPNTNLVSIAGKTAIMFNGEFNGTTTGGYIFTKMRGIMIQITPTLLLEINHFTPTGKQVDFVADDATFNQILGTVKIGS
jgi:hypothetical protein